MRKINFAKISLLLFFFSISALAQPDGIANQGRTWYNGPRGAGWYTEYEIAVDKARLESSRQAIANRSQPSHYPAGDSVRARVLRDYTYSFGAEASRHATRLSTSELINQLGGQAYMRRAGLAVRGFALVAAAGVILGTSSHDAAASTVMLGEDTQVKKDEIQVEPVKNTPSSFSKGQGTR